MFARFDFFKSRRRPDPAHLERRLHKRAIRYWHAARGEAEFLRLEGFDPAAIEERLDQGFLLDLAGAAPVFARISPVLQEEAGIEGESSMLAEVPPESLLARFAAHYPKAVESGEPAMAEYDFVTEAGWHVLCRGALLPLSADGDRVDHVYGVVSWKSEKVAAAPEP